MSPPVPRPDQTGGRAVAVITGTTHGIGRVTARELARAGHEVVMLCRDPRAARRVREEIRQQVSGAEVAVIACDLASLASVVRATEEVLASFPRIDLLINNAAITSVRRRRSIDGFELTFATNHLGPFLLTSRLVPAIRSGGRVVNVASCAHERATLDLGTIATPNGPYRAVAAYAASKLANVMHCFALARRLKSRAIDVNCVHPGIVASHLLPFWLRVVKPWFTPVTFDLERGARSTLFAALSPQMTGRSGLYIDEHQQPRSASPIANDVTLQESLWEASERWIGSRL
ncbi:MAG: SDR family oxidoreductase [Gammaproteobacteria bacterium]|nr:SDR family oxidoreductase [Gammaproteobacteria bacterium]